MNQWFDDVLIAIARIECSTNPLSVFELIELPARSITAQVVRKNGRKMTFTTEEQAEGWIDRNFSISVIAVQPLELTEEIERRKVILAGIAKQEEESAMDDQLDQLGSRKSDGDDTERWLGSGAGSY